ncbi:MAG: lipoprotein-releasing ABC transporter permease subunit [Pseudomonadota bacterium]
MTRFELAIARRYLLPRKGEGFIFVVSSLALLGIAIGVLALIVVMSVMNGFRAELFDKVLGVNGHAMIRGYGGVLADYDHFTGLARQTPGVVEAVPLIERQVMATFQGRAAGALVRGLKAEDLRAQAIVAGNLLAGTLDGFEGNVVAVGSRLAENLGLGVGDRLTIVSPEGTPTPFGTAPRMVGYEVAAIFEVGVYNYDELFIYMPLPAAQVFFRMDGVVSGVEIMVDDPDKVGLRTAPLLEAVKPYGIVTDWRGLNQALFTALEVERIVMFWILSIIIFVAAFNIVSGQVMLGRAKARDIAIMRTMGASRRSVLRIFMLAGGSIGAMGTLLGLALGLLIAANVQPIQNFISRVTGADLWNPTVRFLTEMPSKTDPVEVAYVVGIAMALTTLASLFPAWRASRTDPVKVLRYE